MVATLERPPPAHPPCDSLRVGVFPEGVAILAHSIRFHSKSFLGDDLPTRQLPLPLAAPFSSPCIPISPTQSPLDRHHGSADGVFCSARGNEPCKEYDECNVGVKHCHEIDELSPPRSPTCREKTELCCITLRNFPT